MQRIGLRPGNIFIRMRIASKDNTNCQHITPGKKFETLAFGEKLPQDGTRKTIFLNPTQVQTNSNPHLTPQTKSQISTPAFPDAVSYSIERKKRQICKIQKKDKVLPAQMQKGELSTDLQEIPDGIMQLRWITLHNDNQDFFGPTSYKMFLQCP